MVEMNMIQSLNSALESMLEKDENVVIFGEDVGYFGVFSESQMGFRKNMENIEYSMHHLLKEELLLLHLAWD